MATDLTNIVLAIAAPVALLADHSARARAEA